MEKLKKSRLWLLCGIPGSGKSTWIETHKKFFSEDCCIISRDKIRFSLLKENDDYFSMEKEVWSIYIDQIIESLKNNKDTVLDATHLNEFSRNKVFIALKNYLNNVEKNVIVINTSLEVALERNEKREGRAKVPVSAIKRMNAQMTIPSLAEGFDHIYIYNNENNKVKYQIIEKGAD